MARIIKYQASAHFDIDSEISVDTNDELEIWAAIIGDLESRYGLEITFERGTQK